MKILMTLAAAVALAVLSLHAADPAATYVDHDKVAEAFAKAPALNPNCALIKGTICGVKIEEIDDPLMKKIRYLDKLVDELAKGKAMEKILRS